jgi:hypothetical protein
MVERKQPISGNGKQAALAGGLFENDLFGLVTARLKPFP